MKKYIFHSKYEHTSLSGIFYVNEKICCLDLVNRANMTPITREKKNRAISRAQTAAVPFLILSLEGLLNPILLLTHVFL
jgi:hypothetical protein